jgi:N-methylhydantoinase A/oxoprolinase/acetone carboxylase beta subunit
MAPADATAGLVVGDASVQTALLDGRNRVRARARLPAAGSLRASCSAALSALAGELRQPLPATTRVTLGSGWITSALVHRRGLARVATLRIGGPLTGAVPPLWTWPAGLRAAVSAGTAIVGGGAEYDGRRQAPLDRDAVLRFLGEVGDGADAIAVVGVFSPVSPEDELAVADLVGRELGPAIPVSLGHEIGSLGLLERENATALNAVLAAPAQALATMLLAVLEEHGISAEPFVTQNDGSAMALGHAARYPVLMLESGPALAMRGGAFLSGIAECVVLHDDGEGDDADVGVLAGGLPRDAWDDITAVAGVRTAVRRPDVLRLAVGERPGVSRAAAVRRALVASKILDDPSLAGAPVPVVTVGAGARAVAPALTTLAGVEVVEPPEAGVAGAIGAAVAVAAGLAEVICDQEERALRAAVERARRAAVERAIHAGADPARIDVIEVEQRPLSYLIAPALRVRVRAAGPCL